MDFRTPILSEILDWAINNIFQKVWLSKTWGGCAKGGSLDRRFSEYNDMDYLSHIFSGVAMALKVLDYRYYSAKLTNGLKQSEILSIKRSIFCFLFHDYNKITRSDYKMSDKVSLFNFLDKTGLDYMRNELLLSRDELFQVVFSTESGTSYNIIKNDNPRSSNVLFESNFSRLADQLSSRYNKDSVMIPPSVEKSIEFGRDPVIPGNSIRKLVFGATSMYACEDVARKAFKDTVERNGGFYLWSTNRAVYYILNGDEATILSNFEELFSEFVIKILKPENLLSFNDRSVINSGSEIISHTKKTISNFVIGEEFKKCLWLENIKITSSNREASEKYSDAVRNLSISFSINFRSLREKSEVSIRDGLEIYETSLNDNDALLERLKIFAARYVQLKSTFETPEANKLREYLNSTLTLHENVILMGLLGKIPGNSALLLPFVLQNDVISWDDLIEEILKDLNVRVKPFDFEGILSKILVREIQQLGLPEVPDKYHMSIVNGYPSTKKATRENLFGINTQTFNNRLPTSGISNGKIDDLSNFEFALRKNLIPRSGSGDEGLMFMSFPGAIPFIDMSRYMGELAYSKTEELSDVNELKLSIQETDQRKREVRLDSAYFYSVRHLKKREDILRNLYQALQIYNRTKMHVRLSFSNAPFFDDQNEAVRMEVGNSICTSMGWDKVRCDQIDEVLDQISSFNVVANGSITKIDFAKSSGVIADYIFQPMSLFHHVHNLVFEEKNRKSRGFKKQFLSKINDIRKLAYETNRDGGRKMKNITELAKSAAKLERPSWNMSGNSRTWMLRDSLEALEKARVSLSAGEERDLSELKVFVSGVLLKTLEREKDRTWMPRNTDIEDFTDKLVTLLKEDFDSKVPSGSMKSYLINAFEFEYLRSGKGDEK